MNQASIAGSFVRSGNMIARSLNTGGKLPAGEHSEVNSDTEEASNGTNRD